MDEPRASYIEWSKSEKEKQASYINSCIWNLKKKNEPTRNGLVDIVV